VFQYDKRYPQNISQTGAETVKNNKKSTGFASIAIADRIDP
jgi:hypothetical protein